APGKSPDAVAAALADWNPDPPGRSLRLCGANRAVDPSPSTLPKLRPPLAASTFAPPKSARPPGFGRPSPCSFRRISSPTDRSTRQFLSVRRAIPNQLQNCLLDLFDSQTARV